MVSKYRLTHLFVNYTSSIGNETRRFQRLLQRHGFVKLDTHTYFRPVAPEKIDEIMTAIGEHIPYAATVRVMRITDKQWTDRTILIGKDRQ